MNKHSSPNWTRGRALPLAFIACVLLLLVSNLSSQSRQSQPAASGSPEISAVIAAANRFSFHKVRQSAGQRETIVRFDGATGDMAVLNTDRGVWIRVDIPLVDPQSAQENRAHIRMINDVVFD